MYPESGLDRIKRFLFRHFERALVVLLVVSLLLIHWFVDYKLAFLSFHYLPIILAGFFLGPRTAVLAGFFIAALVVFFQAVQGLELRAGLYGGVLLTLIPWAGFLILTGYVVGLLAEQRQERLDGVKHAYMALLNVLTFHLEATGTRQRGHSYRVSVLATALGRALELRRDELENLRVAALLHEVSSKDSQLLRIVTQSPTDDVPIARAMRGAGDLVEEYHHYYELVSEEWPVDRLRLSKGAKILAVADAFETLQTSTPDRPALARWNAMEEIEKGAGRTFAYEVVRALKQVASKPEQIQREDNFQLIKDRAVHG